MKQIKKKSVNFDCRQYGVSGIGTYIENLIDQFDKIDTEMDFHLLVRSQHKQALPTKSGFRLSEYNETIYSLKEQIGWVTKIDPFGILHVPHYNAPILYPGKLIVTVHDVCHLAMKQYFPGLLKRMYSSLFFKRILSKADHIITVSNFSKLEIIKYFNVRPNKISVIYNGVSHNFRPVLKLESELLLKRYGLPQEYILFLGNIKPHKNVQGVLSSYLKACHAENDLPPLLILGDNSRMLEEIPNIKEYLNNETIQKKVIFTGYLPTNVLASVYSQALMFLFPSFYEGFGLPVLEAMACGTPVITSNCSAIPEVSGDAALLVNPYDDDEIAHQIVNLARDSELQSGLVKKGFDHVKKYSWTKSAEKHLEIYKGLSKFSVSVKKQHPEKGLLQPQKNILFLDQYGDRIGGGQVILFDILKRFQKNKNWGIFVSVPTKGKFTDLLTENGFEPTIVKVWQPAEHRRVKLSDIIRYILSSIKSSYFIGKIIKQNKIDAVYCNGGRTFLNGAFLSMLFPLKVFFHLHLLLEDKQKRVVTMFGRFSGIKKIFAVSKLLEQQYVRNSIHKKMRVVSNWVSPELLTYDKVARGESMPNPMRIGIVGQISQAKGQLAVLNSLMDTESVLSLTLSLFGEPLEDDANHWEDIKTAIVHLEEKGWDIRYEGFKSNKLEIYDNLDVLIIPSFVPESFGLTAIEAMSREVIVVANRSGALVEIIDHQVSGLLYDGRNSKEIIIILKNLLENKVKVSELRKNGMDAVVNNYHPQKQLDMLYHAIVDAVYENV